jgi:hypothetical protein
LYVREAKRLVGDWVWTEHRPAAALRARAVGLGSYQFDSHYVSRVIARTGTVGKDSVMKEGRVSVSEQQGGDHRSAGSCHVCMDAPFFMPYDAMLPRRAEVTNLLVPVAVSASHVRFNAVRMEPTWMILGQSAGAAAVLALRKGVAVADVDVSELQALLVAAGQKIQP